MNAYDVMSRQHRTEISKAQDAGCPIPRQNQLVPAMTRAEFCLANIDLRKRKFYVRTGRHDESPSKPPRDVAVFRGYLVKRGNDLIRIALNAGDPLGHEATVDGPDWLSVNGVARAFHNCISIAGLLLRLERPRSTFHKEPVSTNSPDQKPCESTRSPGSSTDAPAYRPVSSFIFHTATAVSREPAPLQRWRRGCDKMKKPE